MMATESPHDIDRSNEANTLTTEQEPTIKIGSEAQNVPSDPAAHVNGDAASSTATEEIDNKAISDIIDNLVNSAEVSVSGGSDNEASSSSSKLKEDDKGHGRTSSSIKKPISFKAVSVNKTFLAAKGTTTNSPAKPSDKPAVPSGLAPASGTTSTLGARPRLVVKSGSGLVAKSAAGSGGNASAPDASAVWNKNRPVPPPEPKKFTDEELKKYGIHMASRLQSNAADTKGHANWADIDDDDDDGDYLETITWKDGTKITIPQVEEQAPTPVAPAQAAPARPPTPNQVPAPGQQNAAPKEKTLAERPKSPAPGPPPARTLPSGKGLVLAKGAPGSEKPTLVAKPPAPPMPAKSPWASIPKVDKASPIVPELQATQQNGPRWAPRGTTPPLPKEIAVDDFHRSPWKDGPGAPNRELFNSHSGRYEPVQDRRGSSTRNDQHSRQQHPGALLQRAIVHETQGPAEPSSAFQTSRTSEQHVQYGRRRGSSNVSGGSGQFARYKGYEQQPMAPPELQAGRRESFVSDRPASPVRNFSPAGQFAVTQPSLAPAQQHVGPRPHNNNNNNNNNSNPNAHQNWQPHQQPHLSPAVAHSIPHSSSHQPQHPSLQPQFHQPNQSSHQSIHPHQAYPSPVVDMNPNLAAAAAAVVTEQDYAMQKRLMQERRELAMKRRLEQEAQEEAERKERIRIKLEAMGPAPVPRSAKQAAAKQDEATPVVVAQPKQAPKAPIEVQKTEQQLRPSPSIAKANTKPEPIPKAIPAPTREQQPAVLAKNNNNNRNDGVDPRVKPQGTPHAQAHPSWPQSTPQQEQQQRFPSATYSQSSWTAREPLGPVSSSNVWGSPGNDRSLGNGTFNPDLLQRIPDAPLAGPAGKHVPGPIGPPSANRGMRQQQQAPNTTAPATKPGPIGPPSRQLPFQHPNPVARQIAANAWTAAVVKKDQETMKELIAHSDTTAQQLRSRGLHHSDVQAPIKDTWRPTKLNDDGMRKNEKAQQAYHGTKAPGWGGQPSEALTSPMDRQPSGSYGQLPVVDQTSGSILGAPTTVAPQPTKSSRFFPNSRDVRNEVLMATQDHCHHRSSSPSPPPPDMAGHPAFDGDVNRPQVHLPPAKPRVCLPPVVAIAAEQNKQPAFGWANPSPYKESDAGPAQVAAQGPRRASVAEKGGWQDKFDNLLHDGRKVVSPPRQSVPVVSASRSSLEHPQYRQSATVSLPSVARGLFRNLPADDTGSSITKNMAEDCFEEQEMGSVPPVRLPKHAPQSAYHPFPAPGPLPKRLCVMPSSVGMLNFNPDMTGAGTVVPVFVPGMAESKSLTIPFPRTRSNPRRPRNGQRNTSQPQRGGKNRDASSASYSNDHSSTSNTAASNYKGRGGYRSGRDYLPRHQGSAAIST